MEKTFDFEIGITKNSLFFTCCVNDKFYRFESIEKLLEFINNTLKEFYKGE